MNIVKRNKQIFSRTTLILLSCVIILLSGFYQDSFIQAHAQEAGVNLIEGTIPVDVELSNAVAAALERARAEHIINADYYAITDVVDEGEWLFVSVVGLTGIPDLKTWNVVDHGTWFSFVLVQVQDGVILNAAVNGSSDFPSLLERTPETVVSFQTKQDLSQPSRQSVVEEPYIFPFIPGYSIHYGFLGVHDGWSMSAVDLGSDGNTSLNHAPNQLFASASGTVTYRCSPGSGETTGVIRIGDFLYAHLVDSSVGWNISDYVTQRSYLGELETGPFDENCGWASQSANWFHVHFGFIDDPLTMSDWTLDLNTEVWSNGDDTWQKSSWKQIGTLPQVDLSIDSITFTPVTPVFGEAFLAAVQVSNSGTDPYSDIWVDLYYDREPTGCIDFGDDALAIENIAAGGTAVVEFSITDLTSEPHEIHAFVDTDCKVIESDEENNSFGPELVYQDVCYPLTLSPVGNGTITPTLTESSGCSTGEYHQGEIIDLTASPYTGWLLSSWANTDDDTSTSINNTVTMPYSSHEVTAQFNQIVNTNDTVGLYAPNSAVFYLKTINEGGAADITFQYGAADPTWVPLMGDWNGDGFDSAGLYVPSTSTFYLNDSNAGGASDYTIQYGPPGAGWLPLVGDWDGDGDDTLGMYDPSISAFYLSNELAGGAIPPIFYGAPGWTPLTGDWNGDGTDTVGVYNSGIAAYYLRNSNTNGGPDVVFQYGAVDPTWIPLMGDWDGDGDDTVGVYLPASSLFFLKNTNAGGAADLGFQYGPPGAGWIPLTGRFQSP